MTFMEAYFNTIKHMRVLHKYKKRRKIISRKVLDRYKLITDIVMITPKPYVETEIVSSKVYSGTKVIGFVNDKKKIIKWRY